MIKDAKNKMQTANTDKAEIGTAYFFPEMGVTVYANSQEEALKKVQELKDNK